MMNIQEVLLQWDTNFLLKRLLVLMLQVQDSDIEMYSTHIEWITVVSERFIRILKNKIYKYMTSISKNMDINKLPYIVHRYNNIYHKTIKMKPIDVKSNKYIDLIIKIIKSILNLKLSSCKNIEI